MTFWTYVVPIHLLAAVGLMKLCRDCWFLHQHRKRKPLVTHEARVQAILANEATGQPVQQAAAQPAQSEAVVHSTHVTVVTGAATPPMTVPGTSSTSVPGDASSSHEAPSTAGLIRGNRSRYHNNRCGDLAKSRRMHPRGVTTLSRQEAQARGYTACGSCGG